MAAALAGTAGSATLAEVPQLHSRLEQVLVDQTLVVLVIIFRHWLFLQNLNASGTLKPDSRLEQIKAETKKLRDARPSVHPKLFFFSSLLPELSDTQSL